MAQFAFDWFSHNIPLWDRLLNRFKGQPDLHFLEIGCFEGRATTWLLENVLTAPTAHITCLDTFEGGATEQRLALDVPNLEARFRANVAPHSARVRVLKGVSQQELPKLHASPPPFDFVYVDGSHAACDVLEDSVHAWRLCKPGGLVIWDDYLWDRLPDLLHRPGPAVDAFLALFARQYELLHKGYQVAVEKLAR
jgi:predicted O-methyltransferase YrrM